MKGLAIKEFLARDGEKLGIRTQEDLARELGVSGQTVSNWVKGKKFPTHETEFRLLQMGMTVEELFGYPYPSSADALRQKGALWEAAENSLMNLKKDIHMNK